MRVAVVGAGAMGQLFGTKLVFAGHDVVMVDASESVVQTLNERGMTLRIADASTNVAVRAALAVDVKETVDLVMVFTKTMHSREAVNSIAHLIAPHTLGMSVQNGLGNEEPLLEHFGVSRAIVGMTDYPADRGPRGEISSKQAGYISLGGLNPAAAAHAKTLVQLLNKAELNASFHPEIMVPIWEKVMFNAVMNTVSAATGMTVGMIGREATAQRLAEAIILECFTVAHAEGIPFDESRVRENMNGAFAHHGDHKTSMLADLEAGRLTEVESIGGVITRLGSKRNIDTPVLSALNDVVRARTIAHSFESQ